MYARWAKIYVTNITLSKNANETTYYIGDTVKVAGAVITATYNDGSTSEISADDSRVGKNYPDMNSAGNKNVTLSFGGKNYSYLISVKTPSISINGGTNGNRTSQLTASYDVGNQENISINWSSSDTSVATINNGYVAFNKNKGSNASTTITASFDYMGHTYSAGKNISISYGSWSEYSESAVGENDNRQVKTSRRTRKINTNNPSLSGWTLIGKSKNGFSDWESGYRFTHELPEDDGLGTEWSFEGMEYKIFHYHNLYQMPDIKANWGVDSVSNGVRSHYDEKTVSTLPPSNHYIEDKGKNYTQYKFDENQYCDSGSRGWNIWWLKEVNYIYKKRTYEYIYSYTQDYPVYSSRSVNYSY